MSYLLLDTCIISGIIKQHPPTVQALQTAFAPTAARPYAVSIVTRAELGVMVHLNKWGPTRADLMARLLSQCLEIPIASNDLVQAFADLDAFSRNKPVPGRPRLGRSLVMGKNDLWIAATAHVLGAALLTNDGDFDHLHGVFFSVHKI